MFSSASEYRELAELSNPEPEGEQGIGALDDGVRLCPREKAVDGNS